MNNPNPRQDRLSREIWIFYQKNRQSAELLNRKLRLRDVLQRILRNHFPDYEIYLKIVGSTANRLANNSSDVDMCLMMKSIDKSDKVVDEESEEKISIKEEMTETTIEKDNKFEDPEKSNFDKLRELFEPITSINSVSGEDNGHENGHESNGHETCDVGSGNEDLNGDDQEKANTSISSTYSNSDPSIPMLEMVRDVLMKYGNFVSSPQVIPAKVPILKFIDSISHIEVTVNINKCVSIRNTQLIIDYTKVDWRLQPLVMVVKAWAHEHGINNAHNKTISSYSLVLMVIHYLQFACYPPVLPSLQRLQPHKYKPDSDVKLIKLTSAFSSLPRWQSHNNAFLKHLFIGFLEYYSYQFPFSSMAISVRTGGTIPKTTAQRHKTKENSFGQWKYICIEEPFNRSNTARSVYDPIAFDRILRAFRISHYTLRRYPYLESIMTNKRQLNELIPKLPETDIIPKTDQSKKESDSYSDIPIVENTISAIDVSG